MYTFTDDSILKGNRVVMHSWETPVMEQMAKWVCASGGDILEIGFGMGIASNFIQNYNINSHTICDNNPNVISRLKEWAIDKKNIKIVEGDWRQNINNFEKYDGILFDTFDDMYIEQFKKDTVYKLSKQKTNFCIWDNMESEKSEYENCETIEIAVNKSYEDSWNYHPMDIAYLHRITINGET
jgi:hypothetical protein